MVATVAQSVVCLNVYGREIEDKYLWVKSLPHILMVQWHTAVFYTEGPESEFSLS